MSEQKKLGPIYTLKGVTIEELQIFEWTRQATSRKVFVENNEAVFGPAYTEMQTDAVFFSRGKVYHTTNGARMNHYDAPLTAEIIESDPLSSIKPLERYWIKRPAY